MVLHFSAREFLFSMLTDNLFLLRLQPHPWVCRSAASNSRDRKPSEKCNSIPLPRRWLRRGWRVGGNLFTGGSLNKINVFHFIRWCPTLHPKPTPRLPLVSDSERFARGWSRNWVVFFTTPWAWETLISFN